MKNKDFITFIWYIVGISIFFLFFRIYFSYLTTNDELVKILNASNEIGDAIGGLSSPFIGLTAVVLTFMAFWVQYKFNQKQSKFYQNDKLDRKIDDTNKLIETIIEKDSTIFTEYKITPYHTAVEAFKLIKENYLKENLESTKFVYTIIVNHFTDAFIDFYDDRIDDLDEEEVKKAIKEYINITRREIINLRRVLYYFLKEIKKYDISEDEKVELIESFIQRFSLLNNKFHSDLVYIYFSAIDGKFKTVSKRNTEKDVSIIKDITNRLIIDNSEDSKNSLNYLSEKLAKKDLNED